jgi:hypothetical protein
LIEGNKKGVVFRERQYPMRNPDSYQPYEIEYGVPGIFLL